MKAALTTSLVPAVAAVGFFEGVINLIASIFR